MKPRSLTFLSVTVALIVTQNFAAGIQPARAANPEQTPPQKPDFSNVTDILGGRRRLFPVDDLVASVQFADQSNFNVTVKPTQDGAIGPTDEQSYPSQVGQGRPFATGAGRMFDLPHDVVVTVTDGQAWIANASGGLNPQSFLLATGGAVQQDVLAMADFTGDGYADFAYRQNGDLYIATAKDPSNPSAGLFISSPGAPFYSVPDTDAMAMAAGDLDGDGTQELILAYGYGYGVQVEVHDVTIVTDSVQNRTQITGITLTVVGGTYVGAPTWIDEVDLVAGTYTDAVNPSTELPEEDLVVAYKYRQDENNHVVYLSSVNVTTQSVSPLSLNLNVASQLQLIDSGVDVSLAGLASDRLNFFENPTEQVVVGVQEQGYNAYISVLTFDSALNINQASSQRVLDTTKVMLDLAVGNFDVTVDPSNPLSLQIAALSVDSKSQGWQPALHLFGLDLSNNYALTGLREGYSQSWIDFGAADNNLPQAASLAIGDVQGRSMLLGEPTKLTVQHTQPRLVLGMPPMHVDWVTDADGNGPEVLNLSAVLGTYYSSYQTSVSNQDQSSSRSTTSFSNAVSQTISAGYTAGGSATGSVSVNFTESAGLMHNNTVAKQYDTYASTAFDVSAGTGFDDNVWYNAERHNVYIYPVIGQTACPADTPNCSASERAPLTVMFSGPDQILQQDATGGTLEWFQPVWEPGNIFSYPWNLTQLQAQYPSVNLLTSDSPTTFFTDDSTLTEHATWAGRSGSSSTTGDATNIWWAASASVSTSPSSVEGGASGSATLAYNGSDAISSLNTTTSSLGASTGIGIVKPGTFPNPGQYQYGIQPFIFGNDPISGTLQSINLGTDVTTNGILQAAFVADPTDPSAGSWWQGAYTAPDLALNHPVRWNMVTGAANTGSNCLETGNSGRPFSCATLNAPEPDLWNSEFYWMRGLLITPAYANGQGPQIMQATAGDGVQLQVRVYNYSLADMPADSGVVVQFYGQPWNTSNNTPADDAFLIDQVGIAPIPAFNSNSTGGTQPNWALASTDKLDTTAYEDQFLVFWVVVWIQDTNGNLVAEMPDHGLTDIPGTLTDITDAPIEDYSNNVGLFHSPFYIAPQNTGQSVDASAPIGQGDLKIESVTVEPKRALLNEKVSVSAVLRAGDQALDGVHVAFYNGDPDHGGKAFDVENVTHIRAHEGHQVRVPFRAETCGPHTLHVQTHPQAQAASVNFNVRIKPLPAVRDLIRQTKALALRGHDRHELLTLLREARQLFRHRDLPGALHTLDVYRGRIEALRGNAIPADKAEVILAQLNLISSCVGLDMQHEMSHEELMEDQAAGNE